MSKYVAKIMRLEDFDQIRASGCMFARKFSMETDRALVDRMTELAGGAPGVHIYTMNNADVAKQVYAGIRTALGMQEACEES